jgi:preprotein translocase subunit SecF
MMDWIKQKWVGLATAVASLMLLLSVYFLGRRTSKGELDFAAAKRELELTNQQSEALQHKLEAVNAKRVEVVADILSEEIALSQKKKANHELDEADIIDRLRDHGLIK